jgi:hypothetical protein
MYIFVADLGRRVKIHRGSRFEKLLWRVTDLRGHSKERLDIIYAARGHSHPDRDTVHHVFFTCPENAAKAYGWKKCADDEKVYDFYKQRDALLHECLSRDELSLPWWETEKFCLEGIKSLKYHGVEPWELSNPLRYNNVSRGFEIVRTRTHHDDNEFIND